ncbi:cytochrome f [Prochlorococcus sp. MIT 1341]|uniref:cytochrome f n=1 Tax=Prochlorococcus sp. MIT 1341 TaxID=3096221 RepID=UPI002A75FA47|nr:apocytochrome f [Prochlorococcus sp. MIT 1341]
MRRFLSQLLSSFLILGLAISISPTKTWAYPFWAQQNYENPREATGKIVCANCHLAQMTTQAEVPQSVRADSVFKAVVKIPYKTGTTEIGADGSNVPLQVGAVVMLPDGFKLAPQDRWSDSIKEETQGVYYTQYSDERDDIILVGPLPGDQNREIVFPILAPDPSKDSKIKFGKYSIHVGGNRGRGQVYPTGEKSNNTIFTASISGTISSINDGENNEKLITIQGEDSNKAIESIPAGPTLLVNEGDKIEAGEPLTNDPNAGGFGQLDTEVVLQSPTRIFGLLAFFAAVSIAQVLLVLKKKQVEKVQAAEGI